MSSKKSSFVKQAAILAIASLLVRFIGFLYRLPLTSLIGDEGNGIYGKGYTIYTFLLILSSAGMPAAISKMVSERIAMKDYANAHRVFRVSVMVSGTTGAIAALFLGLGAEWLANAVDTPGSKYAILTLAPTVLIVSLMSAFRGYFQGMKNTVPTAISQVVEQIFNAVLSVWLAAILIKQGIEMGAAGGTAGTGIGALVGFASILFIYYLVKPVILKKVNTSSKNIGKESFKRIAFELIKTSVPIIAGTAIFSITNIIDMKMVSSRLQSLNIYTPQEIDILYGQLTGKYIVLTTLPVSISTALATAVVPNIAAARVLKSKSEVNRKINIALKLTMLISIPAAMGIGVLSDQILALLFPKYSEGGVLLEVGAISIVFLAIAQICTGILQGISKVKVPVVAAVCGAIVKIPINYVLIANSEINILGAIISTIACYIVASSIDLGMLIKTTGVRVDFRNIFLKPIIASVIMGLNCFVFYYVVYYIIPSNAVACGVSILIGIVVYFIYMLVFKGITREDFQYIPMGDRLRQICTAIKLLN